MSTAATRPNDVSERILDAAGDCFSQFGQERTTVNDIAQQAKISRTTIYKYYSNRNEILGAYLRRDFTRFFTRLTERLARHATSEEALVEGISAIVLRGRHDKVFQRELEVAAENVLPWVTTDSTWMLKRVAPVLLPYIEAGMASGEFSADLDPQVTADWAVHVALTLVLAPRMPITEDARVPEFLRRYVMSGIRTRGTSRPVPDADA